MASLYLRPQISIFLLKLMLFMSGSRKFALPGGCKDVLTHCHLKFCIFPFTGTWGWNDAEADLPKHLLCFCHTPKGFLCHTWGLVRADRAKCPSVPAEPWGNEQKGWCSVKKIPEASFHRREIRAGYLGNFFWKIPKVKRLPHQHLFEIRSTNQKASVKGKEQLEA